MELECILKPGVYFLYAIIGWIEAKIRKYKPQTQTTMKIIYYLK